MLLYLVIGAYSCEQNAEGPPEQQDQIIARMQAEAEVDTRILAERSSGAPQEFRKIRA